mmetsp:Transcript_27731/g.88015  ORF Transcript_27731/g.88015 Transcript_27731/m.88015 type:complete len:275 (-) Transcript_27731:980-1804(-)
MVRRIPWRSRSARRTRCDSSAPTWTRTSLAPPQRTCPRLVSPGIPSASQYPCQEPQTLTLTLVLTTKHQPLSGHRRGGGRRYRPHLGRRRGHCVLRRRRRRHEEGTVRLGRGALPARHGVRRRPPHPPRRADAALASPGAARGAPDRGCARVAAHAGAGGPRVRAPRRQVAAPRAARADAQGRRGAHELPARAARGPAQPAAAGAEGGEGREGDGAHDLPPRRAELEAGAAAPAAAAPPGGRPERARGDTRRRHARHLLLLHVLALRGLRAVMK